MSDTLPCWEHSFIPFPTTISPLPTHRMPCCDVTPQTRVYYEPEKDPPSAPVASAPQWVKFSPMLRQHMPKYGQDGISTATSQARVCIRWLTAAVQTCDLPLWQTSSWEGERCNRGKVHETDLCHDNGAWKLAKQLCLRKFVRIYFIYISVWLCHFPLETPGSSPQVSNLHQTLNSIQEIFVISTFDTLYEEYTILKGKKKKCRRK